MTKEKAPERKAAAVKVEDVTSPLEAAGTKLPKKEFHRVKKFMLIETSKAGEGKGHSPFKISKRRFQHGHVFDRIELLRLLKIENDGGLEVDPGVADAYAEAKLQEWFYEKGHLKAVA